ncbi:MAG: helix-turn-helix domain-containing protein, partial [Lachnospiraceae bacterium]|nr:helix-turn-helix domain-containing protein [Lachnospiraceae bacterium]
MQDRDILKIPLESEQDFSKFLQRMRGEADVCLEQLAEGLMSASQLARIEKGQRPITKNMRDRLLGRLGVADDLYENLLNIEDYAVWEAQRDILEAVEGQEICRAQELIKNYKKQALADDKIRKQFCLVMEAELLKQRGAASCEIADCYARAVKLTVPDSENLCLDRKLLSIQEINMVLEYAFYHRKSDFAKQCMELMKFVENTAYDNLSKVKIYPKIAWYYLQEIFSGKEERSVGQMRKGLRVCNQAVEMLRDTGRAFYLLELLEMKVKILEHLERETRHGNAESADCQECRELVKLMRYLYDACSVPAYMQECTYLYRQRWVFYIGDVLRIRRKMAGLTQKQLCDGICSVRTLRR